MFVTAYTDASYHACGGWAVWLRSEKGRVIRQGKCPATVTDSFMAELYAIKEALQLSVKEWPDTSIVLVNTDCRAAIEGLQPSAPNFSRAELVELQEAIESFAFANYLTLRFKHVKGHTGQDDTRSG